MKLLTRDTCCEKGTQQAPVCKDCKEKTELCALDHKTGPGRPRLNKSDKKITIAARLSPVIIDKLRVLRINRSQFIEQAIIEKMNRKCGVKNV